jgi:hypothetical protein
MNLPVNSHIPDGLVFNKSAIARVLGRKPYEIVGFQRTNDQVLVSLKNNQSAIIPATDLQEEFHRFRKEAGSELEAFLVGDTHYGTLYTVIGSKGDPYPVEQVGESYRCVCEDWHQHQSRCKHGWAAYFLSETLKPLTCEACQYWDERGLCHKKRRWTENYTYLETAKATDPVCDQFAIQFEEF